MQLITNVKNEVNELRQQISEMNSNMINAINSLNLRMERLEKDKIGSNALTNAYSVAPLIQIHAKIAKTTPIAFSILWYDTKAVNTEQITILSKILQRRIPNEHKEQLTENYQEIFDMACQNEDVSEKLQSFINDMNMLGAIPKVPGTKPGARGNGSSKKTDFKKK